MSSLPFESHFLVSGCVVVVEVMVLLSSSFLLLILSAVGAMGFEISCCVFGTGRGYCVVLERC